MATAKEWHHGEVPLEEINPISSMMSEGESRLLHWLAWTQYKGAGEIVDAGCLLGGSTHALASGLKKNAQVVEKDKRIHSYDIFLFLPEFKGTIMKDAHEGFSPGDSLVPVFKQNTAAFEHFIEIYAGDFNAFSWSGKPIEICFIDLAKTWPLGVHVIREFYGSLIPKESVLLHQDYLHHFCYWIHLTMEYLAEYFERIHEPVGGTVAFRLLKPIPEELLVLDYEHLFSVEEARALMDRAIAGMPGPRRHMIATAKMKMLSDRGLYEEAAQVGQEIRDAQDFEDFVLFDLFQSERYIRPDLIYREDLPYGAVVAGSRNYNIYELDGEFRAIHRHCDASAPATATPDGKQILSAASLQEMGGKLGEKLLGRPETFPILLELRDDQQIIWFRDKYYRVPKDIRPIDLTLTRVREKLSCAESLEAV